MGYVRLMRLQVKLAVIFSVLFTSCLGAMGSLSYHHSQRALKKDAFHHVEHISKDLADRIDSFFYERLISVKSQATSIYLKTRLEEINKGSGNYEELIQQMCHRLEQLKRDDLHISELFILNLKGRIVASTNKNQIGKDKSNRDYFKERTAKITDMYISPTLSMPTMVATAPLVDEADGDFLGIIAARIDVEEFEKVIKRSIGWFEGEEVYVVNKDGFFLVGSIFKKLPPLAERLHSKGKGIENCLKKQDSSVGIYPNYRGAQVVGAYRYLKEKFWVVAVELETRQAFKPIYNLRNWFIGMGAMISFIVIGITLGLAKQITYPLLKLTTASDKIVAGNLDISVEAKTGDEIELLANSFNRMVKDLKGSRQKLEEWTETLEQKVKEKTKELQEKVEELEKFNKLSIGRELKMVELKKKIKELEAKLKER